MTPSEDLIRGANRILAAHGFDIPEEIPGISYRDVTDEEFAYGQMQDEFQNFQGDDKGYTVDVDFKTKRKSSPRKETFEESRPYITGTTQSIRRPKGGGPAYSYDTDIVLGYVDQVAPKSDLQRSLDMLREGTQVYGYDAFPGSAEAEGRLEESIQTGLQQKLADEALARDTARVDARRRRGEYTPDELVKMAREANVRQAPESRTKTGRATAIPRETVTPEIISAAIQQKNPEWERIKTELKFRTELRAAARQPYAAENAAMAQRSFNRIKLGDQGVVGGEAAVAEVQSTYDDPTTGSPIRVNEPVSTEVSGVNAPTTGQALNAPRNESAVDWVARQVDGEGTLFEGRKLPQVDITGTTASFADAVRGLETKTVGRGSRASTPFSGLGFGKVSPEIRSISELQSVVDKIISAAASRGISLPQMVMDEGGKLKPRKTDAPGTSEVLNYLGLGAADQQNLAIALDQVEKAGNYVVADGEGTRRVNEESFKRYKARDPEGSRNMSEARESGRYTPGMTALGKQRDYLTESELAKAPSKQQTRFRSSQAVNPDARQPYIGSVVGDERKMRKTPGEPPEEVITIGGRPSTVRRPGDTVDSAIRRQAADRAISNVKTPGGKAKLDESRIAVNQELARSVREGAGAIGQQRQERQRRERDALIASLTPQFGEKPERSPRYSQGGEFTTPGVTPSLTPSANPVPAPSPVITVPVAASTNDRMRRRALIGGGVAAGGIGLIGLMNMLSGGGDGE